MPFRLSPSSELGFNESTNELGYDDSYNEAYSPLTDTYMFAIYAIQMFREWASVEPFQTYPVHVYAHVNEYIYNAFWGYGYKSLLIGSGIPGCTIHYAHQP